MDNLFDLDEIAAACGIAALEYQAEVASTNDWALQLSADDERAYPLLVLTARQTGGRGRGANRWWSSEGALTFSLVIDAHRLRIASDRWPQLALIAGLAVCQSLHKLFPTGLLALKWPNDVYLSGRKLCGILVEAPSHARGRIVMGVGINVNNSFATASVEVRERATSLCDIAGGTFDLSEVLIEVVRQILLRVEEFSATNLLPSCEQYCLLTGRNVQVEVGRELVVGLCQGIADDGTLLVQTTAGLRQLHSGTVVSWD